MSRHFVETLQWDFLSNRVGGNAVVFSAWVTFVRDSVVPNFRPTWARVQDCPMKSEGSWHITRDLPHRTANNCKRKKIVAELNWGLGCPYILKISFDELIDIPLYDRSQYSGKNQVNQKENHDENCEREASTRIRRQRRLHTSEKINGWS